MKFNRRVSDIKVVSFDLDDTLYDNKPVIEAATSAFFQELAKHCPAVEQHDYTFWGYQRRQTIVQQPMLAHDVGALRKATSVNALLALGCDITEAQEIAALAYQRFYQLRQDINVPQTSIDLLDSLAQRYTLISITNGNADPEQIGLTRYFQLNLAAGQINPDTQSPVRMKPFADMFERAITKLGVTAQQIMHVGDNHRSDVIGANRAGCRSVWFNQKQLKTPASGLADIEITQLSQLDTL